MAIHSIILAWKIPWTEEPSGLQSSGHSHTRLSAVLKSKEVKVTSDWSHISLVVENRSFRVKQNQFKSNFKPHIFTQK